MSTPSVESATEHAVKRHRKDVGRLPRRSGLAPHKRTKATLFTVSKLLDTYEDPRAVLLSIASMDTEDLAKQCKCSMADALAERRLCAQAVLPYVAQKLPISVDMKHTRAIVLNIVDDRQYAELQAVAASDDTNNDSDSFSLQLIATQPTEVTTSPQERDETPVTPPVAAEPPGGYLRPASEWWDSAGIRRQRLDDAPSAAPAGRSSWERLDHAGCFAPMPDKPKEGG